MNWMRPALITIGSGIVTSMTDWLFAGDWLHRRFTYTEVWRQGVETGAVALTSPLLFLTCGALVWLCASLEIHSLATALKLALAVWLIGPLPLILTNAAFMKTSPCVCGLVPDGLAGETRYRCSRGKVVPALAPDALNMKSCRTRELLT